MLVIWLVFGWIKIGDEYLYICKSVIKYVLVCLLCLRGGMCEFKVVLIRLGFFIVNWWCVMIKFLVLVGLIESKVGVNFFLCLGFFVVFIVCKCDI